MKRVSYALAVFLATLVLPAQGIPAGTEGRLPCAFQSSSCVADLVFGALGAPHNVPRVLPTSVSREVHVGPPTEVAALGPMASGFNASPGLYRVLSTPSPEQEREARRGTEPSSLLLVLAGLCVVVLVSRRRFAADSGRR